jgi:hypothetical protein
LSIFHANRASAINYPEKGLEMVSKPSLSYGIESVYKWTTMSSSMVDRIREIKPDLFAKPDEKAKGRP